MIKNCLEKKNFTEWNEWRKEHPDEEILLEGSNLEYTHLRKANLENASFIEANLEGITLIEANMRGANLIRAELKEAWLDRANLESANFMGANLQNAQLDEANFKNAILTATNLKGASLTEASLLGTFIIAANLEDSNFDAALVDSKTFISECNVNRYTLNANFTNFEGVSLNSCRIDPATKQLLEYNIRRKNWEIWYKNHFAQQLFIKPFWWISDYGISTKRIIFTFFGLAFLFAIIYRLFPNFVMVYDKVGEIRGFWHALYFSVVTMTTLGFGDIAANPDSWEGQTLLMLQVILGYVLLGALVTRFAVLFTAGGPAGKFADEKSIWQRLKEFWNRLKKKK
jgi:uncharacterized protein YjbI with pentapeptide repeats